MGKKFEKRSNILFILKDMLIITYFVLLFVHFLANALMIIQRKQRKQIRSVITCMG